MCAWESSTTRRSRRGGPRSGGGLPTESPHRSPGRCSEPCSVPYSTRDPAMIPGEIFDRRDLNYAETCSLRCARLVCFKSLHVLQSRLAEVLAANKWGRRDCELRLRTCSLRSQNLSLVQTLLVQYSPLANLLAARIWGRRDLNHGRSTAAP